MKIGFIQAKGGQGTTTVAAMTALALSETGRTLFVGKADVFAVLGAYPRCDDTAQITETLTAATVSGAGLLTGHYDHHVYDGIAGDTTYLVTRACYLALHATAVRRDPPIATYDGVILIEEPGRALSALDIERALNTKVVATLQWDPAIARAVDAGLLACRLTSVGSRFAKHLIKENA